MIDSSTPTAMDSSSEIRRSHIYKSYTPFELTMIIIVGGIVSMLTPFTDTIYLPALKSVAFELKASDSMVALTVSTYLAAVGLGQLIWGPLTDYYGRLRVLYISLAVYEALTIGCIFADTINTLIVLRTLEGFAVGGTVVVVAAIVSDVFPPEERGTASGKLLAPLLIGPVIAPLVGGIIAQTFTWRGDIVLLAVITVPIFCLVVRYIPETHSWYVINQRPQVILDSMMNDTIEIEALPGITNVIDDERKDELSQKLDTGLIIAGDEEMSLGSLYKGK